MAKEVFQNAIITLNGVDLSDHVHDVTLDIAQAAVNVTAMGDLWEDNLPGMKSGKLDVTLWADFAANSVDATAWAILTGGSAVPFTLTHAGTLVSSTNPIWGGSVVMTDNPLLSGAVGNGLQQKLTFVTTGPVTRGTV